jgi:hypothetical protein
VAGDNLDDVGMRERTRDVEGRDMVDKETSVSASIQKKSTRMRPDIRGRLIFIT